MLRSADWYLVTDVSGQPIGIIFKGQEVQDEIQNFQIHGSDTRGWSFVNFWHRSFTFNSNKSPT